MSYMFNDCNNLKELDLPQFFITNKVNNMESISLIILYVSYY